MSNIKHIAKLLTLVVALCMIGGCWDSNELDQMTIVTGVGIDISTEKDYDLTLQMAITNNVTDTSSGSSNSSGSGAESGSKTSQSITVPCDTIFTGLSVMNRNSNRQMLLDHSRVLLLGRELAEQGLNDVIDFFVRIKDTRMETPLFIIDGRAEEALNVDVQHDFDSGYYLANVSDGLSKISRKSSVRIFDFVNEVICSKVASAIPLVTIVDQEGSPPFEINEMAILKAGVMVGTMNEDEVQGLILSDDMSANMTLEATDNLGKVVFTIKNSKCKGDIEISQNDDITKILNISGTAILSELEGFDDLNGVALNDYLQQVLDRTIKEKVQASIAKAKLLQADVFEVLEQLNRTKFNFWKTVQEDWDTNFEDVNFEINNSIQLKTTGDVSDSIVIKENIKKEAMDNGTR